MIEGNVPYQYRKENYRETRQPIENSIEVESGIGIIPRARNANGGKWRMIEGRIPLGDGSDVDGSDPEEKDKNR